jgi:hypothetical protein
MKKLLVLTITFFLTLAFVLGQTGTKTFINGRVYGQSKSDVNFLPLATIFVKNTSITCLTDSLGNYSLDLSSVNTKMQKIVLVCKYIGYLPKEVTLKKVDNLTGIDFILEIAPACNYLDSNNAVTIKPTNNFGQDTNDYTKSVIYNLQNKSTLTIFEWHVSCRGIYYRKYDIKKKNNKYTLQTYKRVHRGNFPLPQDSFSVDHIFKKIKFTKFKKYSLTDTNVVNFAKFETLGKRDGFKPRTAGDSWGEFFFYYNNEEIAHFTDNTSEQIDDCEEAAIPEKYWDDEE